MALYIKTINQGSDVINLTTFAANILSLSTLDNVEDTMNKLMEGASTAQQMATNLSHKLTPQRVTITENNIDQYFTVTKTAYYFAGSNGVFTSNNQGVNSSTAKLVLTAKQDCTISFDYSYSSEGSYDKFRINHNGIIILNNVSGTGSGNFSSLILLTGQMLELTYQKDGSGHTGDDCAIIKNVVMIY